MFSYLNCSRSEERDELHIKYLAQVLCEYQWLTDLYNVDYFINDHWNKIPISWSRIMTKFDLKDIQNMLTLNAGFTIKSDVLPLSLLSFRAVTFALQLQRKFTNESDISVSKNILKFPTNELFDCENTEAKSVKVDNIRKELFTRNVKYKKRHEIARLSKIINQIVNLVPNCQTIVDCGSGQGHLSRILGLNYGYNVISIEGDSDHISGADKKDNSILKSLLRYKLTEKTDIDCPQKVNFMLENTSLVNKVTNVSGNHVLVGLHACGPLSQYIMKQFADLNEAKALILVGCCYMKIDTNSFPLSESVKKVLNHSVSYQAKEVACHAIEKFVHKLKTGFNLDSLKVHCFRAILESLLDKYEPNLRHTPMKSVKIDPNMTFSQYFDKAVRGLDLDLPEDVLESEFVTKCLKQYNRALIFYSLKLLIAPLVESLILLDFLNYLRERGMSAILLPLFDPILSPRNNVLIAMK